MIDLWHIAEGVGMLLLSGWLARLQSQTSKIHELDKKVAVIEADARATAGTLAEVRDGLADVREHMLRREDVEMISKAMRP